MIVGLDLATSTGFAYGDGFGRPHTGALRMPSTGDDVGGFLVFFRGWLFPLLHRLAEAEAQRGGRLTVVFEAPLLLNQGETNIATVRKLTGLAGVTEMIVADLKGLGLPIEVRETTLSTVKLALAGSGRAEKGDMVAAARAAGFTLSAGKEGQDEADAVGVWIVGLRNFGNPDAIARWAHVGRKSGGGTLV